MICLLITIGTVTKAAEIEFVHGGGKTAASAELRNNSMLVTAVYNGNQVCDIDVCKGEGKQIGKIFSPAAGEKMRAFLIQQNNLSAAVSDTIYPTTGISKFNVMVAGEDYDAFINGDMSKVELYIPSKKSVAGGSSTEAYGIGINWWEYLSEIQPNITDNTGISDQYETIDLTKENIIDLGFKNINIKSYESVLQFKTDFSLEQIHSETSVAYEPERWGMPAWASCSTGANVWKWVGGVKPDNVNTAISGSERSFSVTKSSESAKADFCSYGAAPSEKISRIITEYKIKIDDVDGSGIFIGNREAVVFKKSGSEIIPSYCLNPRDTNAKTEELPLAPPMSLGKWYSIKTLFRCTPTQGGFKNETCLYIDDVYAGSFEDICSSTIGLNDAHTYFGSFDDTTFSMKIDDYSVSYCYDEELVFEISEELKDSLKLFEEVVSEGVVDYLVEIFDPKTGGFYHAISSRDNSQFLPCLEATEFAFEIMEDYGLLENSDITSGVYPKIYSDRVVTFTREMQYEDGFFYDPQWGTNVSDSRRNRDLSWAKCILRRFGGSAKYSYPDQRTVLLATSTFPEYLESQNAFIEYLDSLDWSSAGVWGTGDNLASAKTLIQGAGLYSVAQEYIKQKQNIETGLWGEGCTMDNINGAMKLSEFFDVNNPYPNVEKMVESVFKVLDSDVEFTLATDLWNPIRLINIAQASYGANLSLDLKAKTLNALPEIIEKICDRAQAFKKPDGGYSSFLYNSASNLQGSPSSLGLYESDMDGTTIIADRLMTTIYSIIGTVPPKYFAEYKDEFIKKLVNKGE